MTRGLSKCRVTLSKVSALQALQKVYGVEEIWCYNCITSPPFFTHLGTPAEGTSSQNVADNNVRNTEKSLVIIWDGLTSEERERAVEWMATSQSWVLWRQQGSLPNAKDDRNSV
jgi:hypothetical protein